jgi:hypothetical protein
MILNFENLLQFYEMNISYPLETAKSQKYGSKSISQKYEAEKIRNKYLNQPVKIAASGT